MPKITVHGGPSNGLPEEPAEVDTEEQAEEEPSPDPGTNSSTSSEKPHKSSGGTKRASRLPAPTTENP